MSHDDAALHGRGRTLRCSRRAAERNGRRSKLSVVLGVMSGVPGNRLQLAREVIESVLSMNTAAGNRRLGTWGEADCCWEIQPNARLLLEVEDQLAAR